MLVFDSFVMMKLLCVNVEIKGLPLHPQPAMLPPTSIPGTLKGGKLALVAGWPE
jgi:hypothetical protein